MNKQYILIKHLANMDEENLISNLKRVNFNFFVKISMTHWKPLLEKFDKILLRAALKPPNSQWLISCDVAENVQLKNMVLEILDFSKKLVEHSTGKIYYKSFNNLAALLYSSDLTIINLVLDLLYAIIKKSQSSAKVLLTPQTIFGQVIFMIAQSWNGKNSDLTLAQCCQNLSPQSFPRSCTSLHFEFYPQSNTSNTNLPSASPSDQQSECFGDSSLPSPDEDCKVASSQQTTEQQLKPLAVAATVSASNKKKVQQSSANALVTIHVDDVDKLRGKEPIPSHVMHDLFRRFEIPDGLKMQLFCQIRLAYYFSDYQQRLRCVKARLKALTLLVNSKYYKDKINTFIGEGFIEELYEILTVFSSDDGAEIIELKTTILKMLTSFMANYQYNVHNVKFVKSLIESGQLGSYNGIIPMMVRKFIDGIPHWFAPKDHNLEEKGDPNLLLKNQLKQEYGIALFSFLYHLASADLNEADAEVFVSSGIMKILLKLVTEIKTDPKFILFETRAVRIIDVVSTFDLNIFYSNNGPNILINRFQREIEICVRECPFMIDHICPSLNAKGLRFGKFPPSDVSAGSGPHQTPSNTADLNTGTIIPVSLVLLERITSEHKGGQSVVGTGATSSSTPQEAMNTVINQLQSFNRLETSPVTADSTDNNTPAKTAPAKSAVKAKPTNEKGAGVDYRNICYLSYKYQNEGCQLKGENEAGGGGGVRCHPARAALLKSILNLLKNVVSEPVQTNQHIRQIMCPNFISGLKHIISNVEYYGSTLFLLALDIVSNFIFSEPSELLGIQKMGITDVMLKALLDKEFPSTRKMMTSLPTIFTSLCLNHRGMRDFVAKKPFDKLFRILISPQHLPALRVSTRRLRSGNFASDASATDETYTAEPAQDFGAMIDELLRHQPTLKNDAMTSICQVLTELINVGMNGTEYPLGYQDIYSSVNNDSTSNLNSKGERSNASIPPDDPTTNAAPTYLTTTLTNSNVLNPLEGLTSAVPTADPDEEVVEVEIPNASNVAENSRDPEISTNLANPLEGDNLEDFLLDETAESENSFEIGGLTHSLASSSSISNGLLDGVEDHSTSAPLDNMMDIVDQTSDGNPTSKAGDTKSKMPQNAAEDENKNQQRYFLEYLYNVLKFLESIMTNGYSSHNDHCHAFVDKGGLDLLLQLLKLPILPFDFPHTRAFKSFVSVFRWVSVHNEYNKIMNNLTGLVRDKVVLLKLNPSHHSKLSGTSAGSHLETKSADNETNLAQTTAINLYIITPQRLSNLSHINNALAMIKYLNGQSKMEMKKAIGAFCCSKNGSEFFKTLNQLDYQLSYETYKFGELSSQFSAHLGRDLVIFKFLVEEYSNTFYLPTLMSFIEVLSSPFFYTSASVTRNERANNIQQLLLPTIPPVSSAVIPPAIDAITVPAADLMNVTTTAVGSVSECTNDNTANSLLTTTTTDIAIPQTGTDTGTLSSSVVASNADRIISCSRRTVPFTAANRGSSMLLQQQQSNQHIHHNHPTLEINLNTNLNSTTAASATAATASAARSICNPTLTTLIDLVASGLTWKIKSVFNLFADGKISKQERTLPLFSHFVRQLARILILTIGNRLDPASSSTSGTSNRSARTTLSNNNTNPYPASSNAQNKYIFLRSLLENKTISSFFYILTCFVLKITSQNVLGASKEKDETQSPSTTSSSNNASNRSANNTCSMIEFFDFWVILTNPTVLYNDKPLLKFTEDSSGVQYVPPPLAERAKVDAAFINSRHAYLIYHGTLKIFTRFLAVHGDLLRTDPYAISAMNGNNGNFIGDNNQNGQLIMQDLRLTLNNTISGVRLLMNKCQNYYKLHKYLKALRRDLPYQILPSGITNTPHQVRSSVRGVNPDPHNPPDPARRRSNTPAPIWYDMLVEMGFEPTLVREALQHCLTLESATEYLLSIGGATWTPLPEQLPPSSNNNTNLILAPQRDQHQLINEQDDAIIRNLYQSLEQTEVAIQRATQIATAISRGLSIANNSSHSPSVALSAVNNPSLLAPIIRGPNTSSPPLPSSSYPSVIPHLVYGSQIPDHIVELPTLLTPQEDETPIEPGDLLQTFTEVDESYRDLGLGSCTELRLGPREEEGEDDDRGGISPNDSNNEIIRENFTPSSSIVRGEETTNTQFVDSLNELPGDLNEHLIFGDPFVINDEKLIDSFLSNLDIESKDRETVSLQTPNVTEFSSEPGTSKSFQQQQQPIIKEDDSKTAVETTVVATGVGVPKMLSPSGNNSKETVATGVKGVDGCKSKSAFDHVKYMRDSMANLLITYVLDRNDETTTATAAATAVKEDGDANVEGLDMTLLQTRVDLLLNAGRFTPQTHAKLLDFLARLIVEIQNCTLTSAVGSVRIAYRLRYNLRLTTLILEQLNMGDFGPIDLGQVCDSLVSRLRAYLDSSLSPADTKYGSADRTEHKGDVTVILADYVTFLDTVLKCLFKYKWIRHHQQRDLKSQIAWRWFDEKSNKWQRYPANVAADCLTPALFGYVHDLDPDLELIPDLGCPEQMSVEGVEALMPNVLQQSQQLEPQQLTVPSTSTSAIPLNSLYNLGSSDCNMGNNAYYVRFNQVPPPFTQPATSLASNSRRYHQNSSNIATTIDFWSMTHIDYESSGQQNNSSSSANQNKHPIFRAVDYSITTNPPLTGPSSVNYSSGNSSQITEIEPEILKPTTARSIINICLDLLKIYSSTPAPPTSTLTPPSPKSAVSAGQQRLIELVLVVSVRLTRISYEYARLFAQGNGPVLTLRAVSFASTCPGYDLKSYLSIKKFATILYRHTLENDTNMKYLFKTIIKKVFLSLRIPRQLSEAANTAQRSLYDATHVITANNQSVPVFDTNTSAVNICWSAVPEPGELQPQKQQKQQSKQQNGGPKKLGEVRDYYALVRSLLPLAWRNGALFREIMSENFAIVPLQKYPEINSDSIILVQMLPSINEVRPIQTGDAQTDEPNEFRNGIDGTGAAILFYLLHKLKINHQFKSYQSSLPLHKRRGAKNGTLTLKDEIRYYKSQTNILSLLTELCYAYPNISSHLTKHVYDLSPPHLVLPFPNDWMDDISGTSFVTFLLECLLPCDFYRKVVTADSQLSGNLRSGVGIRVRVMNELYVACMLHLLTLVICTFSGTDAGPNQAQIGCESIALMTQFQCAIQKFSSSSPSRFERRKTTSASSKLEGAVSARISRDYIGILVDAFSLLIKFYDSVKRKVQPTSPPLSTAGSSHHSRLIGLLRQLNPVTPVPRAEYKDWKVAIVSETDPKNTQYHLVRFAHKAGLLKQLLQVPRKMKFEDKHFASSLCITLNTIETLIRLIVKATRYAQPIKSGLGKSAHQNTKTSVNTNQNLTANLITAAPMTSGTSADQPFVHRQHESVVDGTPTTTLTQQPSADVIAEDDGMIEDTYEYDVYSSYDEREEDLEEEEDEDDDDDEDLTADDLPADDDSYEPFTIGVTDRPGAPSRGRGRTAGNGSAVIPSSTSTMSHHRLSSFGQSRRSAFIFRDHDNEDETFARAIDPADFEEDMDYENEIIRDENMNISSGNTLYVTELVDETELDPEDDDLEDEDDVEDDDDDHEDEDDRGGVLDETMTTDEEGEGEDGAYGENMVNLRTSRQNDYMPLQGNDLDRRVDDGGRRNPFRPPSSPHMITTEALIDSYIDAINVPPSNVAVVMSSSSNVPHNVNFRLPVQQSAANSSGINHPTSSTNTLDTLANMMDLNLLQTLLDTDMMGGTGGVARTHGATLPPSSSSSILGTGAVSRETRGSMNNNNPYGLPRSFLDDLFGRSTQPSHGSGGNPRRPPPFTETDCSHSTPSTTTTPQEGYILSLYDNSYSSGANTRYELNVGALSRLINFSNSSAATAPENVLENLNNTNNAATIVIAINDHQLSPGTTAVTTNQRGALSRGGTTTIPSRGLRISFDLPPSGSSRSSSATIRFSTAAPPPPQQSQQRPTTSSIPRSPTVPGNNHSSANNQPSEFLTDSGSIRFSEEDILFDSVRDESTAHPAGPNIGALGVHGLRRGWNPRGNNRRSRFTTPPPPPSGFVGGGGRSFVNWSSIPPTVPSTIMNGGDIGTAGSIGGSFYIGFTDGRRTGWYQSGGTTPGNLGRGNNHEHSNSSAIYLANNRLRYALYPESMNGGTRGVRESPLLHPSTTTTTGANSVPASSALNYEESILGPVFYYRNPYDPSTTLRLYDTFSPFVSFGPDCSDSISTEGDWVNLCRAMISAVSHLNPAQPRLDWIRRLFSLPSTKSSADQSVASQNSVDCMDEYADGGPPGLPTATFRRWCEEIFLLEGPHVHNQVAHYKNQILENLIRVYNGEREQYLTAVQSLQREPHVTVAEDKPLPTSHKGVGKKKASKKVLPPSAQNLVAPPLPVSMELENIPTTTSTTTSSSMEVLVVDPSAVVSHETSAVNPSDPIIPTEQVTEQVVKMEQSTDLPASSSAVDETPTVRIPEEPTPFLNQKTEDETASTSQTLPASEPKKYKIILGDSLDPSFLTALPENIRKEVMSEQIRLRNIEINNERNLNPPTDSQSNFEPVSVEIHPAFFEALPNPIQQEMLSLQGEERDRQISLASRRRTNSESAQLAATGTAVGPPGGDFDPAIFIHSLPFHLRQQVLSDLDESVVALLPDELAREARNLQRTLQTRTRRIQQSLFGGNWYRFASGTNNTTSNSISAVNNGPTTTSGRVRTADPSRRHRLPADHPRSFIGKYGKYVPKEPVILLSRRLVDYVDLAQLLVLALFRQSVYVENRHLSSHTLPLTTSTSAMEDANLSKSLSSHLSEIMNECSRHSETFIWIVTSLLHILESPTFITSTPTPPSSDESNVQYDIEIIYAAAPGEAGNQIKDIRFVKCQADKPHPSCRWLTLSLKSGMGSRDTKLFKYYHVALIYENSSSSSSSAVPSTLSRTVVWFGAILPNPAVKRVTYKTVVDLLQNFLGPVGKNTFALHIKKHNLQVTKQFDPLKFYGDRRPRISADSTTADASGKLVVVAECKKKVKVKFVPTCKPRYHVYLASNFTTPTTQATKTSSTVAASTAAAGSSNKISVTSKLTPHIWDAIYKLDTGHDITLRHKTEDDAGMPETNNEKHLSFGPVTFIKEDELVGGEEGGEDCKPVLACVTPTLTLPFPAASFGQTHASSISKHMVANAYGLLNQTTVNTNTCYVPNVIPEWFVLNTLYRLMAIFNHKSVTERNNASWKETNEGQLNFMAGLVETLATSVTFTGNQIESSLSRLSVCFAQAFSPAPPTHLVAEASTTADKIHAYLEGADPYAPGSADPIDGKVPDKRPARPDEIDFSATYHPLGCFSLVDPNVKSTLTSRPRHYTNYQAVKDETIIGSVNLALFETELESFLKSFLPPASETQQTINNLAATTAVGSCSSKKKDTGMLKSLDDLSRILSALSKLELQFGTNGLFDKNNFLYPTYLRILTSSSPSNSINPPPLPDTESDEIVIEVPSIVLAPLVLRVLITVVCSCGKGLRNEILQFQNNLRDLERLEEEMDMVVTEQPTTSAATPITAVEQDEQLFGRSVTRFLSQVDDKKTFPNQEIFLKLLVILEQNYALLKKQQKRFNLERDRYENCYEIVDGTLSGLLEPLNDLWTILSSALTLLEKYSNVVAPASTLSSADTSIEGGGTATTPLPEPRSSTTPLDDDDDSNEDQLDVLNNNVALNSPDWTLLLEPTIEAFFRVHTRIIQSSESPTTTYASVVRNQATTTSDPSTINETEDSMSTSTSAPNLDPDATTFLNFATSHRAILNKILRQVVVTNNASLGSAVSANRPSYAVTSASNLSANRAGSRGSGTVRSLNSGILGPFSVLASEPQYSHLLDFDIKRRYFRDTLLATLQGSARSRSGAGGVGASHHDDFPIHVRRSQVFEDSYRELHRQPSSVWKNRFYIVFEGEEGQDAGGLLREWYSIIAREIFNPNYALFQISPGDKVTYTINPSSHCNSNHLSYYKFVGRVIAKALFDNKHLECYFTRSFYKHILGKPVRYVDMESEDYDFYQGLVYLLEHNVQTLGYDLTFSTQIQEFGVTDTRDLKPNGRNILVTEDNKKEYVTLLCQMKMTGAIKQQLKSFLEGFYDIIPKNLISIFSEQELELFISGLPKFDIEDLKANTEYHKYQPDSIQIKWFWNALRSFDPAHKAKFLQFVTGTSKVPLQGFSTLEGMNGVQKFQIYKDNRSTDRLPSAHTCFNQLDLPVYESYDKLRNMLIKAIDECSEGFGLA